MCQTTSKHLEENFKNLLGMEVVTDVVFLVLSSETNDWTIYVFATGAGIKIRSAGSTELKNVPYLSCRATCTINVSFKETSMLRSGCSAFWRRANIKLKKTTSLIRKTYFKALKNQEEYFRQYENICCMIFLNKTLTTLSEIVFNISLGFIYDQCHTLHAKPQVFFCVCFGNC